MSSRFYLGLGHCVTFAPFTLFISETMKNIRAHRLAAAFLAGTLGEGRVDAHHSLAGAYFLDKESVLHGKIATFLLRNPHSLLLVDAPDETGQMQQWSIEWGSSTALHIQGVRGNTLKVGDEVTITIIPGKNPADHRGVVKILRRPSDGFEWGTKPGETSPWMLPLGKGSVR